MRHIQALGRDSVVDAMPHDLRKGHRWYAFRICPPDGYYRNGKTYARSSEGAMVAARDAALADGIARPFVVEIIRTFRVEDETVQKTSEVPA